jgi:hypothetical protein
MDNDRNMIIHILANIPQEASRKNTNRSKCNAGIIHIPITRSISFLTNQDNQIISRLVPRNARNRLQQRQQAGTSILDRGYDVSHVCNTELIDHGAADHLCGVGNELVDEDVVVDAITDGASDHADGEGEGCDGGDEVVGADDCGDDGGGDDDTANPEAGEDENAPQGVEVEAVGACECTTA